MSKKSVIVKPYISANGKEYDCRRSAFCANYSPVIVSDNMSGKMQGIPSISTSVLVNPICQARQRDKDSICAHCFAQNTAKRYDKLAANLASNSDLLSSEILPLDILPRFIPELSSIVRFESFGDLGSVNQAINYLNIAYVNPDVNFTIWTKNPGIMAKAIKAVNKPANIRIIYSSNKLNQAAPIDRIKRVFPFVDLVFTVYSKPVIESENIDVNCGARSCATCRNCYDRSNYNVDVIEQLK